MIDAMNKVSARDVAVEAGVSATVVSWVANGTATQHRIGEATQCRVRAVIERMGYGSSPGAGAVVGCQVAELPPAERVVGCQVDKLLGGNQKVFQFSTLNNQQLDNLTTLLAAAGYNLVPVTSINDLPQLPDGLVGVVYQGAGVHLRQGYGGQVGVQGSVERDSNIDRQDVQDRVPVSSSTPEIVVPVPVISPVDADVPAASVTSENPPGTDGDGTSPSTLAAEPVTIDPPPEPIQAPVEDAAGTAATTEEVPGAVESPVESSVVTAVPGGTVTSENPPGSDGDGLPAVATPQALQAGTSPSTLPTEPVVGATPSSTTQQPGNPTTVLPPAPVDIEVAAQVPETPHLDPLPQGERKEDEPTPEPTPQPPPVAVVVSEQPTPEPPVVEPIPPVAEEAAVPVVVPEPLLEPVTIDPPPEPIQAPIEDAAETHSTSSGQAAATIEEVPGAVESPVESSVVTAVPGGTVTSENPPGTDGDGTSPVPEPVRTPTPTPAPISEPVAIAVPEPEAALVVPVIDTSPAQAPVKDAAETAATTEEVPVAVESSTIPPITTQQPSNPTTLSPDPSPEEVGAADQLPQEPIESAEKVTA